jgi:hypothetical protein
MASSKIKNRWACDHCSCINEKRPAFKSLVGEGYTIKPHRSRVEIARQMEQTESYENLSNWVCDNCLHPAKFHSWTFKEPVSV